MENINHYNKGKNDQEHTEKRQWQKTTLAGFAALALSPENANASIYDDAMLEQMHALPEAVSTDSLPVNPELKELQEERKNQLIKYGAEFFFQWSADYNKLILEDYTKEELLEYKQQLEEFELQYLNLFFQYRLKDPSGRGLSQDINAIAEQLSEIGEVSLFFNFAACQKMTIDRALFNNEPLQACPELDWDLIKKRLEE